MNWLPRTAAHASFASRPLELLARADLVVEFVTTVNGECCVVKDPLSLKIYRLSPQERTVLKFIEPQLTWNQLIEHVQKVYPAYRIELKDLVAIVRQLCKYNLVVDYRAHSERWLYQATRNTYASAWQKKINLFGIRICTFDPDPVLTLVVPYVRWMFASIALTCQFVFVLMGFGLVMFNAEAYFAELPSVQHWIMPSFYVSFLLVLAVVKLCHESAHAIACKHFGGECHRMGIILLVLMPTLYVDTSDSWLLKRPLHRAMVALAGIWAELLIASAAGFIWYSTTSGLVHVLAMQIILLCSISTIAINANPLLKYDGYYFVSDLLNIQNLSRQASNALVGLVQAVWFGSAVDTERNLHTRGFRWLLISYGFASFVYRAALLVAVACIVTAVADAVNLRGVGYFCVTLTALSIVSWTSIRMVRFWKRNTLFSVSRRVRALLVGAVVTGVVCYLLTIPLPVYISGTGLIHPEHVEPLYLKVPGVLREIRYAAGDVIKEQDLVAQFENPKLDWQIAEIKSQRDLQAMRVKQYELNQGALPKAAEELLTAKSQLMDLQEQLEQRMQQKAQLAVRVPRAGVLLDLKLHSGESAESNGKRYESHPAFNKESVGAWFDTGSPLLHLCSETTPIVEFFASEKDASRIHLGDAAMIHIDAIPGSRFRGRVMKISKHIHERLPIPLTTESDGEMVMVRDGSSLKPWENQYAVRVQIEDTVEAFAYGQRVHAKVKASSQSLVEQFWRGVSRLKWMQ